ncbi:hypothetical protein BH23GEM5_BH23GEM5_10850 [soil metagenome]
MLSFVKPMVKSSQIAERWLDQVLARRPRWTCGSTRWRQLRPGDTLVVWRLDRLGRSLKELVHRVEELQQKGIGVPRPSGGNRHHECDRQAGVPRFLGNGRV